MSFKRLDGRAPEQVRPITVASDVYGYAHASVLYQQGNTKVLCGVTLQAGVPPFLKGQRTGWLSAEYAMLPAATHQRTQRETTQAQRNARSVEISRLIGRCLRPTVNLQALGERTIVIDCDVLQADGSTRVACISASSMALVTAAQRWVEQGLLDKNVVHNQIAAVSVGMINQTACADLAYEEDAQADADFNIVLDQQGHILEIQGTAEKKALSWDQFDCIKKVALQGVQDIFAITKVAAKENTNTPPQTTSKPGAFSLANRLSAAKV
ncbi:ribonuclease PH [bacterium]|nr:ribonuclease PH [bacterium]